MRCPFATWQGSPNDWPGRMAPQPKGVVLHIEQGSEASAVNWFHLPGSQASAHFGVAKDGHLDQFVDTADAAWAEADGNPEWISIEHEGFSGETLSVAQFVTDARLIAWLKGREGGPGFTFPLQVADSPATPGIGWHGMGGVAWGNHPDCPGEPIKTQRPQLIAAAANLLGTPVPPAPAPAPRPPERWLVVNLPVLQQGATGDSVRALQRLLTGVAVDGEFGPVTRAAVIASQHNHNLLADGIVGVHTWGALLGAPQ